MYTDHIFEKLKSCVNMYLYIYFDICISRKKVPNINKSLWGL